MTQPWDLPTKPSNWETKFVLRSGTIPVVLGGRQPPFHQQELLQENLPQFETALTPQQATQNAEPAAPGDTAFQHKMIPVRVEGVPPSSDEREQLQEILNQLERALTPQQAMQNAEPAAQGDTAFQHKAIPVVLGGRPPSFDEQEQLREILNQLERALTPQHAVAQAQQADLRDTAFQHKVIPVRVEGVPPSVELRPRANLSVQPAEHDLTEGSREAVPALRSPFTEASRLGLSGTVGSLTFVLLLGVGVTWLLSSGSPSQLGESDQVGASTPGDPLEGQGDEPIPGIAIKDASSPPLTMVAHWLPASLTMPELNEEISIAIGSSPPVVHETLVPALVVTSSPDQPFMPHLAIEVASNPASTSAVNWLPSPLWMPDADEGMPQSVNPLPPVVHVQPAPTLVVISSHDQPLPDRAIESASNPALSSAANWQPSPLRLPESDEGPPSALDTLSLAVHANSAQALAVISLPERPPPRGVAIEPTSNPALTDAVHWSPSLLAMPELNESMSFAVGRLLPITHANSAPTLAIISPPDLPPSQMDHLQSPEGPLQVSNMAQTSATSLDGLYYQVALHLPPDLAQVTIDETQSALQAAGLEVISTSVPRFGVARSEVRFFHVEDASEAARLAELMNAGVRDYSAYRPVPPPGTLEVWLAPEADE